MKSAGKNPSQRLQDPQEAVVVSQEVTSALRILQRRKKTFLLWFLNLQILIKGEMVANTSGTLGTTDVCGVYVKLN